MSKLKTFALTLIVLQSVSLHAFEFNLQAAKSTFGKIVEGAKKGIEKELEKEAERKRLDEIKRKEEAERLNPKTNNSKILIKQNFEDAHTFALLKITKETIVEDVIVEIKNKTINRNFYLREGQGAYNIKIYASTHQNPYGGSYTYISELNVTNTDARDLKFLLPSEEVQSDDQEIIRIAESLISDDMTDLEKVKAAHNFVAERIDYDNEGYKTGSYVNNPTDAAYVLQKGVTVCAGYSSLYAAIVRAMGIRASVIHGKAFVNNRWEDHAWNEVFVDGKWNIVDVTWDDMNEIRFDYFFPTDENFSKDHKKEKAVLGY
jgi:transglutaminase/protease-like cytokinesis protein 3